MEDAAPVAEAAQPATPTFLRDDERLKLRMHLSKVQESKDVTAEARSHLRAPASALPRTPKILSLRSLRLLKRLQTELEDSEELGVADAVVESYRRTSLRTLNASPAEDASAGAEDSLTTEDLKANGTGPLSPERRTPVWTIWLPPTLLDWASPSTGKKRLSARFCCRWGGR